eukprot:PLAT1653.2.p1 GENE.PLAT1653.2~~PLAT1653.2.p1  ORF type:complete len:434 (-),score=162.07 PLAT1653.2:54-1295(-)
MADFVVIGGGIIGVNIALLLKQRYDCSVTLVEKEDATGKHASGRNSSVLHAGFYYHADSLRARFTVAGNKFLTEYCEEHGLPLAKVGKLVVTKTEDELAGLQELYERGQRNGVELHMISAAEAEAIQPGVRTVDRALWSPNTSSGDCRAVIAAMTQEAKDAGVVMKMGAGVSGLADGGSGSSGSGQLLQLTDGSTMEAGYVINAAGLYADKLAHSWGFGHDYTILPFKGLYLECTRQLKTNIYPVPDLKNTFLGVHFTVTADGHTKVGPTAIPCLWREQYTGLTGFSLAELIPILGLEASLFVHANFNFRGLALDEMKMYYKPNMAREASKMVPGLTAAHFPRYLTDRAGIRAQLVDLNKRTLVTDFCMEGDNKSFHVLNAISPAWTCSRPFTQHVVDIIDDLLEGRKSQFKA